MQRKVLLTICGSIGLLPLVGVAYQILGSRMDSRRLPEPGRLVDVGGYRLKINCAGSGSPTVVLEGGLGDMLSQWRLVQMRVSSFTRVCSYDRAGYGESDAGPFPRTSLQISRELHTLLQNAREHPPYILVGHSFGGYNVRVFDGTFPNEVVGMILADSPQEDQYELLPLGWRRFGVELLSRWQGQPKWMPPQITFGIARLRFRKVLGSEAYLILQSKYLKARASELKEIQTSAEQARASGTHGDKPLVVLTATQQDEALRRVLSPEDFTRFQELWVLTLQPRLLQLSTRSKQIIRSDAGHDIPTQRPEAIVDVVRQIQATKR